MLYYNIEGSGVLPALRCGAPVGMKWFRSNIKTGSRLALFALAIQFALSFGHFHEAAAQPPRPALTSADLAHAALDTAGELQQRCRASGLQLRWPVNAADRQ